MSLQANKALVRCFVEEVQNQKNIALMDELYSTDFVDHSGMTSPPYLESSKVNMNMFFAAFPDPRFTIRQQLAEEDKVMTFKSFHGTHQGEFMGLTATGKEVAFDVIDIFTIRDGKISEHWVVTDMLSLMQQLGIVPLPG